MSNVKTLTTPVNYWGEICDTMVINPSTQVDIVTKKVTALVVICPAANVVNGIPQTSGSNPNIPNQIGNKLVKGFSKTFNIVCSSFEPDAVIASIVAATGYNVI